MRQQMRIWLCGGALVLAIGALFPVANSIGLAAGTSSNAWIEEKEAAQIATVFVRSRLPQPNKASFLRWDSPNVDVQEVVTASSLLGRKTYRVKAFFTTPNASGTTRTHWVGVIHRDRGAKGWLLDSLKIGTAS